MRLPWPKTHEQLTERKFYGTLVLMETHVENTIAAALELPAQARAFLAEKLIESLDLEPAPELSDEWRQEVAKRCREIDEGLVVLRDAQAVFDRAYATLE